MKTIEQILFQPNLPLPIDCIAGHEGLQAQPFTKEFTGISNIVGYFNPIHPSRIQILGVSEHHFFTSTLDQSWDVTLKDMCDKGLPALVITAGFPPFAALIEFCNSHKLPLLQTTAPDIEAIEYLRFYLSKQLALHTTMHGVFLDVLGMGVLIAGESGVGKSELALELISRGHGLVADDAVDFYRISFNTIEGRCPELLSNLIEVRGLGLLDIKAIFGETSVRRKMNLKLIVILTSVSSNGLDRFPIHDEFESVLGVNIQKFVLPVAPGRNLAVLVEAAVRKAVLQKRGINTMADFMQRQAKAIERDSAIRS